MEEEVQALVIDNDTKKNGNPFDSDPITGPRERENNGHGNNELGLDFTNPGKAFGYVDGIPICYLWGCESAEVTPAPGAYHSINLYANGSWNGTFEPVNDGAYDNSGF